MYKKLFLFSIVTFVFLSGCTEAGYSTLQNYDPRTIPTGDPNTSYYDSGRPGSIQQNCGGFEQPCCEWAGTDAFGLPTGSLYCYEDFECKTGQCVEGATYK